MMSTERAIAIENAAKAPVEAWLATHDRMDWPNLRHPTLRRHAALAVAAEAAADLAAFQAAWTNWVLAVWTQVPADQRPAEAA